MATDAFGFDSNKFKVAIDAAIQEALEDFDLTSLIGNNLSKMYPIGSIYISERPENPSTFFGFGTWIQYATGRTLVGVDPSDPTFSAPGNKGGSKETEQHTHKFTSVFHLRNSKSTGGNVNEDVWKGSGWKNFSYVNEDDSIPNYYKAGTSGSGKSTKITIEGPTESFGGGSSGNLQPFITVYIWKRTA